MSGHCKVFWGRSSGGASVSPWRGAVLRLSAGRCEQFSVVRWGFKALSWEVRAVLRGEVALLGSQSEPALGGATEEPRFCLTSAEEQRNSLEKGCNLCKTSWRKREG